MKDPVHDTPLPLPPIDGQRTSTVKDGDLATPMELREFLGQVGSTMRLPKRTTVAMPTVAETTAAVRSRAPVLLPAFAVISLAAWAAVEFSPPPVVGLPSAVQGTWVTDDPRYAGRTLEFGQSQVTVTFPGGRETTMVRAVRSRQRGDTIALVVRHGEAAQPQELSLGYLAAPEEHLVLSNPAAVRWFRRSTGGA